MSVNLKSQVILLMETRVRLRPQNVPKLLFLKYNLKAISYNSVTLPEGEILDCNRDCQQLQTEVGKWFIDEDL